MSIDTARDMFLQKIGPNCPPYAVECITFNNDFVKRWHAVLERVVSTSGGSSTGKKELHTERMEKIMEYFIEGEAIKSYMRLRREGCFFTPKPEQLEKWKIMMVQSSITELKTLGSSVVGIIWGLIRDYIRDYVMCLKWENVYSQSEDPVEWEKLAIQNKKLFEGECLPFWTKEKYTEIQEKVLFAIKLSVNPLQPPDPA